jgi:uncharacterized protein YdaU (DUF1376 family)
MANKHEKSKPVFFHFYADDFIAATSWWEPAWVGAYMRLLMHQFSHGHIPRDPRLGEKITGLDAKEYGEFWAVAQCKFEGREVGTDAHTVGVLVNPRMEAERQAAIDRRSVAVERARKGGKAKAASSTASSRAQASSKRASSLPNQEPRTKNQEPVTKSHKPESVRARPSSKAEVEAYAKERGNIISAEEFWDANEQSGWKLSNGQACKDWKARYRQFERYAKNRNSPPPAPVDPAKEARRQKEKLWRQGLKIKTDDELFEERRKWAEMAGTDKNVEQIFWIDEELTRREQEDDAKIAKNG